MVEWYLRSYVLYQQSEWVDLLPFAEMAYNNTIHRSTGLTPFQVVMGKDFPAIPELDTQPRPGMSPAAWADKVRTSWPAIKQALKKAEEEYKHQADKRRTDCKPLHVGDQVFLSTKYIKLRHPSKKLGPKYLGPFRVTKVINPVTVRLHLPPLLGKIHPVFHVSLLKLVEHPPSDSRPGPVYQGEYEIEDILDSKLKRGRVKYLVKWKGYSYEESSWVHDYNITAPRLLRQFHRKYPHLPRPPP